MVRETMDEMTARIGGDGGAVATIASGGENSDYPFECSAGLVGDSYDHSAQSGPGCSRVCPVGRAPMPHRRGLQVCWEC